jgi:hypothetical protein
MELRHLRDSSGTKLLKPITACDGDASIAGNIFYLFVINLNGENVVQLIVVLSGSRFFFGWVYLRNRVT